MAREDFIPVTGDDWYQRRRQDAEGEFFRKVADQGPRKGQGGSTRQGIYMLTASGKLLGYKNAGQNAEVMRETLQRALAEWKRLPAAERQPGAVSVPPLGKVDANYSRTPPKGTAILKVYTRLLERDTHGQYSVASCEPGRGGEPGRDHLWVLPAELQAIVDVKSTLGVRAELPRPLVERLCRFHLIENTRGEPPLWSREQIRNAELSLSVKEVSPQKTSLSLTGRVLLATNADTAQAERGFEARLIGTIEIDRVTHQFTRFDVLTLGEHWGEGTYTRGARPGRTPLGIWFELAKGDSPADLVPPQGAREWREYAGRSR